MIGSPDITRRSLLVSAGFTVARGYAQPRRPNNIFVLSGGHHFQCVGAAGNPHIRTPNLDR